MMYHITSALIVAMAINFTFCAAECQEIQPVEINVSDSGGLWYQIARYWNEIEISKKCASFVTGHQEKQFRSESVGIPKDSPNYIYYEATPLPEEEGTNKYDSTLTSPVLNKSVEYISQYVEFTSTYFIVHGCLYECDKDNWVDKYWIFSRTKQLTDNDAMKVNKTIAENKNIKYSEFIWIDNNDCGDEF